MSISSGFPSRIPIASQKASGLMSSSDKIKLDNINPGDILASKEEIDKLKDTITPTKVYGIAIDMSNSDPYTCVTYTDDALGFTPLTVDQATGICNYGSWDLFIHNTLGVKPCLFKSGRIISYLNENDYSKTVNGNNIDIESGGYGDVMIEFSKIYYKLSRVGNLISFKVSNKKSDNSWLDAAFACNDGLSTVKNKMYIAAYQGTVVNARTRSISNSTPTDNIDFETLRFRTTANGSRYQLNSIVKYTFIKYLTYMVTKSLNVQTAIGKALNDGVNPLITGTMNQKGLFFGTSSGNDGTKIFGIENLYGSMSEFVEGLILHLDTYRIKTSGPYDNLKAFIEIGPYTSLNGYITKETIINGILSMPEEVGGSTSTYFCDSCDLVNKSICVVGGHNGLQAGLSYMTFLNDNEATTRICGRMCY